MTTTFKSALAICGLSQPMAADYLDVSQDTIAGWSSGRSGPSEKSWTMLSDLYARIERAADHGASIIETSTVDPRQWGNIEADLGPDPLPEGADNVAGAMAMLLALQDQSSTNNGEQS